MNKEFITNSSIFIKEKLNKDDKIILVGLEHKEEKDFSKLLENYNILFLENNSSMLNKIEENGKSLKEICFMSNSKTFIKNIKILREISKLSYDLLITNGYIILEILNVDKFLLNNKEENNILEPMWKEDIISVLKAIGFSEVECFGSYDLDNFSEEDSDSIIIRGRKHIDLLGDKPEYEKYGDNYFKSNCCCTKKQGKDNGGGCSGCCKKGN